MKTSFFSVMLLFCTFSLFSQGNLISDKWKVKSAGISLGSDQDMLMGMDHGYFVSIMKGQSEYDYSNLDMDRAQVGSMICENPHIRLNLTLLVPGMKNTELNLALVGIAGRIDYVNYITEGLDWNDWDHPDFKTLTFDLTSDEIDLELGFLKRLAVGKGLNFYGGLGTNLGVTLKSRLSVSGYNIPVQDNSLLGITSIPETVEAEIASMEQQYVHERQQAKTAFSQRLFAQVGLSFAILSRFELGLEYRRGFGYRAVGGAPVKATNLQSVGLTSRWILR